MSSMTQPDPNSSFGPFTETFQVTGMTCDHCVRAVTAGVGQVDGVTAVTVDLPTGQISVDSDQPIGSTTVAAVAAAVDEAGYTLA
jgi:copper ion binding protein